MLQYSPKIITDSLVMCLDASNNKSFPIDLPIKDRLALWLDAADDTTFSYSSGTSVSQWRDKSGNNRHFFQATAGNQPSRNSVINSRKTVQFTAASSQYLRYNDKIINNTTAGSVFFVWRTAGETQAYANLLDNYHAGSNALNAGFTIERNDVSDQLSWGFYSSGFTQAGTTGFVSYSNNTSYVYYITKDSTNIAAKANGYSVATNVSPSATWVEDTKGWLIGCWGSNTETFSRFYNGQIAEIIIFSKGLSDTEAKQVTNYLSLKWNTENINRSIFDLSGFNDNGLLGNGTVANMPAYDYYNKGSLRFDGSDDYLSVADNVVLNPVSVTVSMWLKRNAYQSSICNFLRRNDRDAYALMATNNTDTVWFRVRNSLAAVVDATTTMPLNTWTNLVGTFDGSNVRIYKDGALANTTANTSPISYSGSIIGDLIIARDDIVSGRYAPINVGSTLIYSRALSAAEIAQNYEAQKSKFANTIVQNGLVLNLDAGNPYSYAGSGTTWIDVSGAVNDFAAVGSPTYSANEFILNGTTQYFSLLTAASGFFINTTNNFYADVGYAWTISAWFKFPVSPTSVRDATIAGGNCSYCIFGNGGGIGGAETLALFVSGISGTSAGFHPYYCVAGLRGGKTQLSLSSVNTNTWNNVVITWDGTASRGYFNGVDRGALASAGAGMQINGYTIGSQGGGQSQHFFEGSISQTFVYSRAISAAEVLQNYNALKGRFGL